MSPVNVDNDYNQVELFCTPDSFAASSNYINILLTSYGYSVPLVFNSTNKDEQCKIVNCIYTLINNRKNDALERQELVHTINELKVRQTELDNHVVNLKRETQLKDKHCNEFRSKLEANEATYKKQNIQNTRLKEEITKVKNNLQFIKTQYAHETSRHEQELAKVQDRLTKCMNSQYKSRIASSDINSQFATTINDAVNEDRIVQIRKKYDDLLSKANNRERDLKLESEELRKCLVDLYTNVRRLLENQINRYDSNNENITQPRDAYAETARFRLPMNFGGKEAIQLVEDLLVRLKEEWNHQMEDKPKANTSEEIIEKDQIIDTLKQSVEDLLETIDQLKLEYEENVEMYKRFEQGGFFDTLYPTPKDAYNMSESEDSVIELENEDETKYNSLRKKALRDQRRITESAIELGQQRAALEAERWAFQEMKREIQLQEILQEQTPSSPKLIPRKQSNIVIEPDKRKKFKSWLGSAPSNN
ncbi:unnamed protein product [Mucor hiemalis]